MPHPILRPALLVLFSLLPAWAGGAEILPKEQIDRMVKPVIDGQYARAIVVGLIDSHGRQVVGYGRKSDADPTVPDAQSVFEIGSVSKTFTATLLAEAVLRGDVVLEDPAQKYLPAGVKMPHGKEGKAITLLHLTTHSSGLPRMPFNFAPADPGNPYADYTVDKMYAFLSELNLPAEPGERCLYSNLGVGLLGHLLSLRAGKSYEDLLREGITRPLKMQSTQITLNESMRRRLVPPCDVEGNTLKNWDLNVFAGAGGIRSTADDLLTYVAAETGLIKTDLAPAMALTQKRQREFDKNTDIGLGWLIVRNEGWRTHNGQTGGYHTAVLFDHDRQMGVVVLSTTTSGLIDVVGMRLMQLMHGYEVRPPQPRQSVTLDDKLLDRYVGEYKMGALSWMTIQKTRGYLTARLTGQSAFRIYPESSTKFFWKIVDAEVTFDVDAAGKVTGLVLHQNGNDLKGEKK